MLCQIELTARLDLQKISGLDQAIPFPKRSIAADGEQCPLLLPAGSVGAAAVTA